MTSDPLLHDDHSQRTLCPSFSPSTSTTTSSSSSSSSSKSPISQPILEILTRNFQDAFRFPKNTLSVILTLNINNNIIIIIIVIFIKVLPSSTTVSTISQPILEILTRNFQDAFRFPKNTLSLILALNINNNIIIIIFLIFIKVS